MWYISVKIIEMIRDLKELSGLRKQMVPQYRDFAADSMGNNSVDEKHLVF